MLSSFTKDEKKMLGAVLALTIGGMGLMAVNRDKPQPLFMDSYHGPAQTSGSIAMITTGTLAAQAAGNGSIDVNSANAEVLAAIPGVGPSLAREIIEHRNSHGPFRTYEDLDAVKGIGPAKLLKIRQYVSLGQSVTSAPQG